MSEYGSARNPTYGLQASGLTIVGVEDCVASEERLMHPHLHAEAMLDIHPLKLHLP